MRFDVVTIFPGFFASPLRRGARRAGGGRRAPRPARRGPARLQRRRRTGRSTTRRTAAARAWSSRRPPLFAAVEALRAEAGAPAPHVVFLSPQGRRFDAALAKRARGAPAASPSSAGATRAIDERAREAGLFDEEVSLGDFVLSGGEVAALALVEAVSRYVPGVVGDAGSVRRGQLRGRPPRPPALHAGRGSSGGSPCRTCSSRATTRGSAAGGASSSSRPRARRRPDSSRKPPLSAEERAYLERLAGPAAIHVESAATGRTFRGADVRVPA